MVKEEMEMMAEGVMREKKLVVCRRTVMMTTAEIKLEMLVNMVSKLVKNERVRGPKGSLG